MKKLCLIILIVPFFYTCNSQENNLKNTFQIIPNQINLEEQVVLDKFQLRNKSWHISRIIGSENNFQNEYILSAIDTTKIFDFYGNSITFKEDNTFVNAYSAPCGNDCFPSAIGKYYFVDENSILIDVNQFDQFGDCENISKKLEKYIATFKITKTSEVEIKFTLKEIIL